MRQVLENNKKSENLQKPSTGLEKWAHFYFFEPHKNLESRPFYFQHLQLSYIHYFNL